MDTSFIDYITKEGYVLVRPDGLCLHFTSDDAVLDFIDAMRAGGANTMIEVMVNDSIFTEIAIGDVEAATSVVGEFFAGSQAFYIWEEAQMFYAADAGAETLVDVLVELGEFLWEFALSVWRKKKEESARADPSTLDRTMKALEYFDAILQDPAKRADWSAKRAALRASRPTTGDATTKPNDDVSPTWSITTTNLTVFETLTFVGDLPYTMPSTYTVLKQPERSFTLGAQTLAWSPANATASSFFFGDEGYCVTWKTENGHSFAVNIWIPIHVFGVGADPYYQVWFDAWGPRPDNWLTPHEGPTSTYTFPGEWGYTVKVVPTYNKGKLSVAVTVGKKVV